MTTTDLAQGRRVAVPGVTAGPIDTFYLEAGSGDPVVLLHGSGPGVSGWANWQHTIPGLAEHFRVIAPDTVGYGATSRPGDIVYSLRTWSDHILGLLDVLELDRVSLVGNSLGGRMALDLAERHPERISRMVLMGSPGVGMTVTDGLKALRAYAPSLENMRALLLDYFAVNPSIITDELVRIRYQASLETFDAYRAMFLDPRHKGNELGITEEQVRSIRTPSLLIHGREDKVVPPEVSWTMLHLLQDADLHVFARCGHWTQIERAAEFNELVADFLRG
ncbi:alpha/beta hydrolase [Rhodococcus aetherivorans]|jgi:2-hydroxymuconate-semialdehyde hydrolase/2-hydroxy-6-oxo-octa-2,4-dienoate hydrolase|uniref:Alpha/beta fold hydrolase n=1 Tax=Rhodococcus aetherivorans TaxID=191292 RepID=A0AA46PXG4_9NOCA|nr:MULTISPECIES: alpha/beta hydrolase [Rhodococcus]KDE11753.1 2-hydroxy-6-oxo-2,4-heptadienoate hydrolase [Rhodococcus aetherivorans]PND49310.1 2-hydroxy-6-oxo-2,4-heptadienoate hydrolase [Rhodococcus sp. ENV425]USC14440.1 alpha/beta fold hydrolase [Rhodococcus sp. 11-3]UYF95486.1 alpha/beta fold hydrolase [Rhodococcus aetherivorans]WFS15888.1 alpha/beta hydrolase [Rhodococcus aetherivorans]